MTKPAAIDSSMWHFHGSARVYDSEEAAVNAIKKNQIQEGQVLVIRYEGPKGGPGMREMFTVMKLLYGKGLALKTALVTDGRFSGTNNGCFVGHVSPEAAEGGPLAAVRDGDGITIDIEKRLIHLHLQDQEIRDRLKDWVPPTPKVQRGYLSLYARLAESADQGAIIKNNLE